MTVLDALLLKLGTRRVLMLNGSCEGTYGTVQDDATVALDSGGRVPLRLGGPDELFVMAAPD